MKKIILLHVLLLTFQLIFAQPFIHDFFPLGVCNFASPDTFLNKRAILKQQGIKQIISYQESANTISTITTYINKEGSTEKLIICTKGKKKDFNFCNYDTIIYDNKGRMLEERFGNLDIMYTQLTLEYMEGGKVKQTQVYRPQNQKLDTNIRYRYYNEKGQLVRIEYIESKYGWDKAFLFYNNDGFLDSIRHDAIKKLMVFKRIQKGKNKIITLEEHNGIHTWVYNSNDQCISKRWKPKNNSALSNGQTRFYYNPNGTLSKVIERNGKNSCTTTYSYEK